MENKTETTLLADQTADMVKDIMGELETKLYLFNLAHKGEPGVMLDLKAILLDVYNLRMVLAESGVYNPEYRTEPLARMYNLIGS